jgi:CNT family concentrative nucleoside transporter
MFYLFANQNFARIVGILFIILIGYFFSSDRKNIDWKSLSFMFFSIFAMGYFFYNFEAGIIFIDTISMGLNSLYNCSNEGIKFLFGSLIDFNGPWGFIFAVRVLPVIIFFSALTSILYYYGIIQFFVSIIGRIVKPVFGTNGAETLCAVANSFLGQTEAPLLIRSYLKKMNESEIFAVMVSGMGTISAAILTIYACLGVPIKHLLISSVLSIPSTLFISKLWHPNTSKEKEEKIKITHEKVQGSLFENLALGIGSGLNIALNVGAMLVAIISILYCIDNFLYFISFYINKFFGFSCCFSLQSIFSVLMWPFSWMMGISFDEIEKVAYLIGTKVAINEMIAYAAMLKMNLSSSTIAIATYALCGFSNFSCIGIQLAGIGILESSTKPIIARLGVRAVFASALSNILIACIMGFFIK